MSEPTRQRLPSRTHRGGRGYELYGRRMPGGIANVTNALVANSRTSVTLSLLEDRDLQVQPDGSFVITIDERPAGGLPATIRGSLSPRRSGTLMTGDRAMLLYRTTVLYGWLRRGAVKALDLTRNIELLRDYYAQTQTIPPLSILTRLWNYKAKSWAAAPTCGQPVHSTSTGGIWRVPEAFNP